jgi:hypothetical protein
VASGRRPPPSPRRAPPRPWPPPAADVEAPELWRALDLRRVPTHLRGRSWRELAGPLQQELPDRLVLTRGDAVLRVLSKFEDPQYIHTYEPADAAATARAGRRLTYELPRFNLEFALDAATGDVVSLQHRRPLAACQQLAGGASYTLPNFGRYLVLADKGLDGGGAQGARRLVLVPSGRVLRDAAEQVDIKVDGSSAAELKVRPGLLRPLRSIRFDRLPAGPSICLLPVMHHPALARSHATHAFSPTGLCGGTTSQNCKPLASILDPQPPRPGPCLRGPPSLWQPAGQHG